MCQGLIELPSVFFFSGLIFLIFPYHIHKDVRSKNKIANKLDLVRYEGLNRSGPKTHAGYLMYLKSYALYTIDLHHESKNCIVQQGEEAVENDCSTSSRTSRNSGSLSRQIHRHLLLLDMNIYPKPLTAEAKELCLQEQRFMCHGCGVPLEKKFNMYKMRTTWDSARWCHYSGKHYCHTCNTGTEYVPIPARIVFEWDVTERKVSRSSAKQIRDMWRKSVVCVSAENPLLYEKVPALQTLRQLRLELCLLHDVWSQCPTMCQKMLLDETLSRCDACYYRDTERFSLCDLYMVNTNSAEDEGHLHKFLITIRETMAQHVKFECVGRCLSAHRHCENCTSREAIFAFDTETSAVCNKCQRVFHKACLRKKACPCVVGN